jgi:DNA repair ATPase RecN
MSSGKERELAQLLKWQKEIKEEMRKLKDEVMFPSDYQRKMRSLRDDYEANEEDISRLRKK